MLNNKVHTVNVIKNKILFYKNLKDYNFKDFSIFQLDKYGLMWHMDLFMVKDVYEDSINMSLTPNNFHTVPNIVML